MARITAAGLSTEVVAVDLPGQHSKRIAWFDALRIATAVTFVIDSTDVPRFALIRQELHRLVSRLCKLRIPILFLATKQDMPEAWAVQDILVATDIAAICAGLPAPWTLRGCSATDYWDLTDSFRWLVSHINDMRRLREEQALCAAALYQQANIQYAAQLAARVSTSMAGRPLLEAQSLRSEGVR
jgi:signal recognition particle receptor subunit beta